MKINILKDRKRPIVQPKEKRLDEAKIMELAYQSIMKEIIEYVIEGVCFETHRAVKLGYFPLEEYDIKEHEFELNLTEEKNEKSNEKKPKKVGDIFFNDCKGVASGRGICPKCLQPKGAKGFARHVKTCRVKANNSPNYIDEETNSNGNDNFNQKNDAKPKPKSETMKPSYETMSPKERQEFLVTHCGVVSRHTGKPCSNSKNCTFHLQEDKDEVRNFISACHADHSADDNIDIDTVD